MVVGLSFDLLEESPGDTVAPDCGGGVDVSFAGCSFGGVGTFSFIRGDLSFVGCGAGEDFSWLARRAEIGGRAGTELSFPFSGSGDRLSLLDVGFAACGAFGSVFAMGTRFSCPELGLRRAEVTVDIAVSEIEDTEYT